MKNLFKKITIVLFIALVYSCNCNNSCEEPLGLITQQMANDMEELYKANQYMFINDALSSNGVVNSDNREYWFSHKELKDYLCYVERKADSLDINKDHLGIRVYNGAKFDGSDIPKSSIFFVATKLNDTIPFPGDPNDQEFIPQISALNYGSVGEPPIELTTTN